MAVTGTPKEQPQTGTQGNVGARTAVRKFDVMTTSETDTVVTLMNSSSIVQEGDAFPGDASMLCKNVTFTQNKQIRTQWEVTATYERPQPEGGGPGSGTGSPEDEVPEYSVGSQQYTKFFEKDANGVVIKNSANESFVPPPEGNQSIGVYRITRNRLQFNDGESAAYRDTVNADAFTITATETEWQFAKGTCYLQSYDGVRQYRAGVTESGYYWRVTWIILWKEEGWRKSLLDQGLRRIPPGAGGGSTAISVAIKGVDGLPVNELQLLDGAGEVLGVGLPPVFLPLGGLGFQLYRETPFAALPLSITPTP